MNINIFVGVDVSKETLDYSVVSYNQELLSLKTENSQAGIARFIKELKKLENYSVETSVFCMEFTGIYNNHLLNFLQKKQANIWLENPIHIKRSSGLNRGKSDKVDALRIAQFAYKNRDEIKLWVPKRASIQRLKSFTVIRNRIIKAIKQLSTPLKESEQFISKQIQKEAEEHCSSTLKNLKKDLQKIEKSIALIIKEDQDIKSMHEIITSIPGLGTVTATEIIVCTNEFKDINDPKKFACYAGVAPFEHSSGSSIRGRTRVSKMANKSVKMLLHMAALTAIIHNQELKEYYQRKVVEGKNKMSVINAVRNKLILRVFACVQENRKYEKNYINQLA